MRSPFPGMDPFIEACGLWHDFHTLLIVDLHRVLSQTLPPRYVVRAEERSYIQLVNPAEELSRSAHFTPDISVRESGHGGAAASAAVAAPAEAALDAIEMVGAI